MEGCKVLRVAHLGSVPGDVDVEPCSLPLAHSVVVRVLGSREEGPILVAMQGDVEDTGWREERVGVSEGDVEDTGWREEKVGVIYLDLNSAPSREERVGVGEVLVK